jgi:hypothetical protein
LLQEGDIFLDQLFLEIDGIGGDDNPFTVANGPEYCREKIGQGLAGAGARLDQGHPFPVEGLGNVKGHSGLLVPMLVAFKVAGKNASGSKKLFDLRKRQVLDSLAGKGAYRGAVLIFDSRVLSKKYGRFFLDSLPKARITRGEGSTVFQEMERFFRVAEIDAAPGESIISVLFFSRRASPGGHGAGFPPLIRSGFRRN